MQIGLQQMNFDLFLNIFCNVDRYILQFGEREWNYDYSVVGLVLPRGEEQISVPIAV